MTRARKIFPAEHVPREEGGRRSWQAFLSSAEREEQEKLTLRAQEIDAERRTISQRLLAMRSRCMTRRRYFEQHPADRAA